MEIGIRIQAGYFASDGKSTTMGLLDRDAAGVRHEAVDALVLAICRTGHPKF